MKKTILYSILYYLFWIIYFQFGRLIFIIYQYDNLKEIDCSTFCNIFVYGLKMDLSFAGYLSIIPFFILSFYSFIPLISKKVIKVYTYLVLLLMSFLFILDIELFRVWGYKIDDTILKYLDSPSEMIASSLSSPIVLLIIIFSIIFTTFILLYNRYVHDKITNAQKVSSWNSLIFIFLTASLFLPIRGGFGLSTMNQSKVCFSSNNFANQAAINYAWNFFDTIIFEKDDKNLYKYMDNKKASAITNKLYNHKKPSSNILKTKKPNIVFIIWESFTYKIFEEKNISPEFNNLLKDGVFFNNIYANGDRSDKGLVAILSAYPTVPGKSIISKVSKAAKLPQISKTLSENNYETAFFYGGEIEFFRLKSYLSTGSYSFLISKKDFDKKDMNSKWGAHDHIVYSKLKAKIEKAKKPFFYSMFTLSSHEPYDIPIPPLLAGDDEETKFRNSMYYADKSLGDFIAKMKKTEIWDNTVFIIVADHGHRLPNFSKYYNPEKFHIPMLWLGGALNVKDTIIHTFGNQTDIANTLLSQMNISANDFKWSKNLLSNKTSNFAYYTFSYGYGLIQDSLQIVFDAQSENYLLKKGKYENFITKGNAILQSTYKDFYDK